MKVIHTSNIARELKDYELYTNVSLVGVFGMYTVIFTTKAIGKCEYEKIELSGKIFHSLEEAMRFYIECGGSRLEPEEVKRIELECAFDIK